MSVEPQQAPAIVKGLRPYDPVVDLSKLAPDEQKALQQLVTSELLPWSMEHFVEPGDKTRPGKQLDFNTHRYMLPIFMARAPRVAVRKAAQLGATIWLLCRLLFRAKVEGLKCGLYFPDEPLMRKASKTRIGPFIDANPDLAGALVSDEDDLSIKEFRSDAGGTGYLLVYTIAGKSATESQDLDVVAFDELRGMDPAKVQLAEMRILHSMRKERLYVSTAGMPEEDIDREFNGGTQNLWTSICGCPNGVVLADHFPECIVTKKGETYYKCPVCNRRIRDPRNGNYVSQNPGAPYESFGMSQFDAPFNTPDFLLDLFRRAEDVGEWHRSIRGRPFLDKDARPITFEVLESACADPNVRWAKEHPLDASLRRHTAMGVDHHAGNAYVVIGRLGRDGRKEITHLEIADEHSPDMALFGGGHVKPLERVGRLMVEHGVRLGVIDQMPDPTAVADLAREFPGRLFLASYNEEGREAVTWLDREERKKRKASDLRVKWRVLLHRYLSLDHSLGEWVAGDVAIPNKRQLTQLVRDEEGRFVLVPICEAIFFKHLRGLARKKVVVNRDEGRWRMVWERIGADPHFAHAWNYCSVALDRLSHRGGWASSRRTKE